VVDRLLDGYWGGMWARCGRASCARSGVFAHDTAGSGNSGPLCITLNLFTLASVDTLQGCTPSDSMASTPKKDKQLTVKFHSSELAQLRESAKQRQQPVSVMVREALRAAGVPIAA
jgi:hypothetical protein